MACLTLNPVTWLKDERMAKPRGHRLKVENKEIENALMMLYNCNVCTHRCHLSTPYLGFALMYYLE